VIQYNPNAKPRTLLEAVRYFSDLDRCDEYLASIVWPDGKPTCPKCGSQNATKIISRRAYQCRERGCRRQFRLKAGTIFQDSPLSLDKWLVTAWMLATCRNGISSCEVARTVGVKQQSAWHMLHRLRAVVKPGGTRKLSGTIESDETFVGGLTKYKSLRKRRAAYRAKFHGGFNVTDDKAVVQAFLERGGEVRARVVPNTGKRTLQRGIQENVEPGSALYTDAYVSYRGLSAQYAHEFVNHMIEYVRGNVHTNGIECFFSCLRRSIKGTYVSVEPEHLEAYCDEQAYRFTFRHDGEWHRFDRLMHRVIGKRLTYSDLTSGKTR
jgi:transposase-like protein